MTGFNAPDGQGFNLTQTAIGEGYAYFGVADAGDLALKTNAVVNLSADLVALNTPALTTNSFKLFRYIPTDYVRAIDNASDAALGLQAITTVNTAVNAINLD